MLCLNEPAQFGHDTVQAQLIYLNSAKGLVQTRLVNQIESSQAELSRARGQPGSFTALLVIYISNGKNMHSSY